MKSLASIRILPPHNDACALDEGFPIAQLSKVAEQESWRKEINRPIYHIHKWWATRLGSVFRALTIGALSPTGVDIWDSFYTQHDFKDKVVLDPFMGSGTTLGEALKLGSKAIGCDINPISTFLVQQALTHVAEDALRVAFARLKSGVESRIAYYYKTRDPDTNAPRRVMYYFWVKTLITPDGETVPLFDSYIFSKDAYPRKKPKAQILCPACWNVIQDRYDSVSCTCPRCGAGFNPQEGPAKGQHVVDSKGTKHRIKDLLPRDGAPPSHRMYASMVVDEFGNKTYQRITDFDLDLYSEAVAMLDHEDLPLPTMSVRSGHNTNQAKGYNYHFWRDFFNARQLLCLGFLLREIIKIEDQAIREQFLCLFSSTLEFNNIFCSFKGEGTGAVRHMFSNHILKPERTPLENSVWGTEKSSGTFVSLFKSRLLRAKRYLDEPFELEVTDTPEGKQKVVKRVASQSMRPRLGSTWSDLRSEQADCILLNGNSAKLPLPDGVVDAVITDPPYFDFVHYSELSDFFYAWLSTVLRGEATHFSRDHCGDDGEVQQKDPRVFAHNLSSVLRECSRVMKDQAILAFSFHHSRPEGWAAIHEALTLSGLSVVAAHPVHAELRAANPKSAAKDPISIDAVLVCRKRSSFTGVPRTSIERQRVAAFYASTLESAGMKISSADQFVIAAAQLLIDLEVTNSSYEAALAALQQLNSGATVELHEVRAVA